MHSITVQTTIDAPVAEGFRAWMEPEQLSRWFTTNALVEPYVGGRYSNDDGDRGEFLAIEPNRRIRFTWDNPEYSPGTLVEVELLEQNRTEHTLRITHSGLQTEKDAEGMNTGWSWALVSIRSWLETGTPVSYETWQSRNTMGVK